MLSKEQIIEILHDWNFWHRPIDAYIGHRRLVLDQLLKAMPHPEVKVLTGVRRAGKTTIMYQLMHHAVARGSPPQSCLYVNFEDPAFLGELESGLLAHIYRIYRENIHPAGEAYLFLDEIQHIAGWEKWVRAEYDKKTDIRIVVSGSNSSLLQTDSSTLLTGRNLSFEIRTLSFREFLKMQADIDLENAQDYFALSSRKSEIKYAFKNYLAWGGFPATLERDEAEKKQLLKQYFEDIINKDIVSRYRVRDTFALKRLAVYLMQNCGNLLSFNSLQKSLGINKDTGKEYLSYFEDAYLAFQVLKFSYSLKKSMANNRKIYACDAGLRNAVSYPFTKDYGRVAENLVYLKLREQYEHIFYWKNTNEVDFIAVNGVHVLPINVCYSENIPDRELKGLAQFMREFDANEAILVSEEKQGTEKIAEGTVRFIPLWYFLLQ